MRLSDSIEAFIKQMLAEDEHEVELKRNELAQYFGCAPSQINYVLSTRFTPDDGYMTESKRGGGGCIRIVRITTSPAQHLTYLITDRLGDSISEDAADRLIGQLVTSGTVTQAEGRIMQAAVSAQALSLPMPENMKDAVRAKTLRCMLASIAKENRA